jgi:hypothetical protein
LLYLNQTFQGYDALSVHGDLRTTQSGPKEASFTKTMNSLQAVFKTSVNPLLRVAFLCLFGAGTLAADGSSAPLHLLDHDSYRVVNASDAEAGTSSKRVHPGTPLILAPVSGAFDFDLGGSEIPKLQLQLAHPLQLQGNQPVRNEGQPNVLGLDATLTLPLNHGLSLQSRAERVSAVTPYQALGSIQCMNGTLKQDSYTASGCRFVNDQSSSFDRQTLSLGASKEFGNFSTSINWFTSQLENGQSNLNPANRFNQAPVPDPMDFSSSSMNGILPGISASPFLESEASGVDLNFQVGFTTDRSGEVQLGLALTRVYDASLNGLNGGSFTPLAWNDAEPFNAASLGIEWSRGSFSSGIRGYYRDQVDFLGRQSLNSIGTFDVHFTWRAPWNANFSVGASNVLGAGVDDRSPAEKPVSADRFESIYGRIPYVRYQQDL